MPLTPLPEPGFAQSVRVLGFDTSTEYLAVGLRAAGRHLGLVADGGAAASATLLPHVNTLLAQAGLTYADLDFIAFGRGPGAFTGLRTACAVAQGLGFALNKPLLAIDSLLIVAEDARQQLAVTEIDIDIGVVMDARMDEVYAGIYRWRGGCWRVLQPAALMTLPALAQAWAGQALHAVAGSALSAFGPRLVLPPQARALVQEQDRAGALLRLAVQAAQQGLGMAAATALPLYLRDKVAQTTSERAATRAAAHANEHADERASGRANERTAGP